MCEASGKRCCIADSTFRVDGTLHLLANAGMSHGLPSRLVGNLSQIQSQLRKGRDFAQGERRTWNPQLAPDSPSYKAPDIRANASLDKKKQKEQLWRAIDDEAYNPIGEVIKLAEGRDKLTLGRMFHATIVAPKRA
jgi:hypothetical protein